MNVGDIQGFEEERAMVVQGDRTPENAGGGIGAQVVDTLKPAQT